MLLYLVVAIGRNLRDKDAMSAARTQRMPRACGTAAADIGALKLCVIVVAMFGFGYALVPFYEKICEATGLRNIAQADVVVNTQVDATRDVRIEFDSNIRKLPWTFRALTPVVDVHPGEVRQVVFEIVNATDRPLTGQAIPSYGPPNARAVFPQARVLLLLASRRCNPANGGRCRSCSSSTRRCRRMSQRSRCPTHFSRSKVPTSLDPPR